MWSKVAPWGRPCCRSMTKPGPGARPPGTNRLVGCDAGPRVRGGRGPSPRSAPADRELPREGAPEGWPIRPAGERRKGTSSSSSTNPSPTRSSCHHGSRGAIGARRPPRSGVARTSRRVGRASATRRHRAVGSCGFRRRRRAERAVTAEVHLADEQAGLVHGGVPACARADLKKYGRRKGTPFRVAVAVYPQ